MIKIRSKFIENLVPSLLYPPLPHYPVNPADEDRRWLGLTQDYGILWPAVPPPIPRLQSRSAVPRWLFDGTKKYPMCFLLSIITSFGVWFVCCFFRKDIPEDGGYFSTTENAPPLKHTNAQMPSLLPLRPPRPSDGRQLVRQYPPPRGTKGFQETFSIVARCSVSPTSRQPRDHSLRLVSPQSVSISDAAPG